MEEGNALMPSPRSAGEGVRKFLSKKGQYLPFSAMTIFSATVLLVASVDVYQVSRAKLKVQNLADAVALNIASQEARVMNFVADQNEWANHLYTSGDDLVQKGKTPPWQQDWQAMWMATNAKYNLYQTLISGKLVFPSTSIDIPLPPLSFSDTRACPMQQLSYFFNSESGAAQYGQFIMNLNNAQRTFIDVYNRFIGATDNTGSKGNISPSENLEATLYTDIPELSTQGKDSDQALRYHLVVWNDDSNGQEFAETMKNELIHGAASQDHPQILNRNRSMVFTTKPKDRPDGLEVRYLSDAELLNGANQGTGNYVFKLMPPVPVSELMLRNAGKNGIMPPDPNWPPNYMTLDVNKSPMLTLSGNGAAYVPERVIGARVFLVKDVYLPVGPPVHVAAQAMAYVVNGSGEMGLKLQNALGCSEVPVFSPTYMVKLAKPQ